MENGKRCNMYIVIKQGFSLIELMVVIAIVAVLAAVAVPSYKNYISRTINANAIAAVAPALTDIQRYYSQTGGWPTSITYAGQTINLNQNGGWSYATYSNIPNVAAIQYGCNTIPSSLGTFLWIMVTSTNGNSNYRGSGVNAAGGLFLAVRDQNGAMQVACGSDGLSSDVVPANCQTDIKAFTGTSGCF